MGPVLLNATRTEAGYRVPRPLSCARLQLGLRGQLCALALLCCWFPDTWRLVSGSTAEPSKAGAPTLPGSLSPTAVQNTPTAAGSVDIPSQTPMRPSPYRNVNENVWREERGSSSTVVMATDSWRREHFAQREHEDWDQKPRKPACTCTQSTGWKASVKKKKGTMLASFYLHKYI